MSTTATSALLQAALEYASYGWRVIPLHNLADGGGCSCHKGKACEYAGKHPRHEDWPNLATTDEQTIAAWWRRWPAANVGIVFGKDSGIIDIECDGPEEERLLLDLFGGDMPITPCYQSSRGKHRLFRYRDDLPDKAVHKIGTLGLRIGKGGGAMSVAPPSRHPSGKRYTWLVSPEECDPPPIPDAVLAKIVNGEPGSIEGKGRARKPAAEWERIGQGVNEGERDSAMLAFIGRLLCGQLDLSDEAVAALYQSALAVNEKNRPPLPENKVKQHFTLILEKERRRRAANGEPTPDPRLPQINVGVQDLPHLTRQAWDAIRKANDPPRLFRFGGSIVRIERDEDDSPIVRDLSVDRTRNELVRVATFVRPVKARMVAAVPPDYLVRNLLASPEYPLPVLERIVEAPVFAPDGSLETTPRYHAKSRTFYAPAVGFAVPPVPDRPIADDIDHARELLEHELLGDFPFASPSEKAHAIALALLPFARGLIDGPTPIHIFEKPTPGTGATLLIDLLTFLAIGRPLAASVAANTEDEMRKAITSRLRRGAPYILFDNLKERLDSGALAAAVTAREWEDRALCQNELIRVSVRSIWIASGNNPTVSNEISRRCVRIRLDAKKDRPWTGRTFRHPDIRQWAAEHRGQLVWACLVMIRSWLAAGRRPGPDRLGMFESWSETLGGILQHVRIEGFLANTDEFYDQADEEAATLRAFVAEWWAANCEAEVATNDLWKLVDQKVTQLHLGKGNERSQKTRLGLVLASLRDRVFTIAAEPEGAAETSAYAVEGNNTTKVQVCRLGKAHRLQMWKLRKIGRGPER